MYWIKKKLLFIFLGTFLLIFAVNVFCQTRKETSLWQKCQKQISTIADPQKKIEIYQKFVREHPRNYYVQEARERIAELEQDQEFKKTESENTVNAYTAFINKYPKSKLVENAKEKLLALNITLAEVDFLIARALNTATAYEEFVKKYPESTFTEQANQKINELKNCKLSISSIPEGADVYLGPGDLSSSVENSALGFYTPEILVGTKYLKGKTPFSMRLEPGVYQIAVMTSNIPEKIQKKYSRDARPGLTRETVIIPLEGCMTTSRGSNEEIVSIFRNQKIVRGGKIYRFKIEQNEEKTIDIRNLFEFN